jgi:type II secretory pathway pseudopilin PulG
MNSKNFQNKGFTLIEITLVLGLTLGLATALIFGLSAFTNGADRAKCLLNMNNVQKAVRSLQNLNEFKPGEKASVLSYKTLWGSNDAFLAGKPVCPRAGGGDGDADSINQDDLKGGKIDNYKYNTEAGGAGKFPLLGHMYIVCEQNDVSDAYLHYPKEVDGIKNRTAKPSAVGTDNK